MEVPLLVEADATMVEHKEVCLVGWFLHDKSHGEVFYTDGVLTARLSQRKRERCLGITEGGTIATTADVLWLTSESQMGMRSATTGICWKCCVCLCWRLLGSVDFGERCLFRYQKHQGRGEQRR
ncbi:hypothetical protein BHE74_00030530 [Ensete ventricosum]|nr:hypothetical protein BHE74_00030530 [Ensete ventricosum]